MTSPVEVRESALHSFPASKHDRCESRRIHHDSQGARRAGFCGKVTGIDLSPYLVRVAGRLSAEEGLAERVEFRAGDTRGLNLPSGSFDAVIAHTLVSHVDDPLAVVSEAARLVRTGGMVGIFDGDYASLTFDHADSAQAKEYDDIIISSIVTSPRTMRQMPRLLRAAGLTLVASFPSLVAKIGRADFLAAGHRLAPEADSRGRHHD